MNQDATIERHFQSIVLTLILASIGWIAWELRDVRADLEEHKSAPSHQTIASQMLDTNARIDKLESWMVERMNYSAQVTNEQLKTIEIKIDANTRELRAMREEMGKTRRAYDSD